MSRYDKYNNISGGFRAPLAADTPKTGTANPLGVGLDTNGRVVAGIGNTGIVGVMVLTRDMKAGDVVDVMTGGEIVECVAPLVAGTTVTALTTTGVLGVTAADATHIKVGRTVEAARLVVRVV